MLLRYACRCHILKGSTIVVIQVIGLCLAGSCCVRNMETEAFDQPYVVLDSWVKSTMLKDCVILQPHLVFSWVFHFDSEMDPSFHPHAESFI